MFRLPFRCTPFQLGDFSCEQYNDTLHCHDLKSPPLKNFASFRRSSSNWVEKEQTMADGRYKQLLMALEQAQDQMDNNNNKKKKKKGGSSNDKKTLTLDNVDLIQKKLELLPINLPSNVPKYQLLLMDRRNFKMFVYSKAGNAYQRLYLKPGLSGWRIFECSLEFEELASLLDLLALK